MTYTDDRDDLGMAFYMGENGRPMPNGNFWAWRVGILGEDGKYHSPEISEAPPVAMGETARDTGVGRSLLNDPGGRRVLTMDDIYKRDIKRDTEDASGPDDPWSIEAISGRHPDRGSLMDEMLELFLGREGEETYLANPLARSKDKKIIVTRGPEAGLALIGVANGANSIISGSDMQYDDVSGFDGAANQHTKGNVEVGQLARDAMRRLHRDNRTGVHEGNASPLSRLMAEEFKKGPFFRNVLTAEDRKLFEGANDWHGLLDALKNLELSEARELKGTDPERASLKRQGAKGGFMSRVRGGIVSPKAFDPREGRIPRDFVYDKTAEALTRSLRKYSRGERGSAVTESARDPSLVRLLQVLVPLDALYGVDDVLRGKVSGKRNYMNEFRAAEFQPFRDIGGADELLGKNSALRDYWILRLNGVPANKAWNAALGEKFGDIRFLIGSDERIKDVKRDMRNELRPLMRQCMITHGITRGL